MSALTDGIDAAFATLADLAGTSLTVGAVTKTVILSPVSQSRDLRDSGLWAEATSVAEIKRADFIALSIADRTVCTVAGKSMRVVKIDDDPSDTIVRVGLRVQQ